MKMKLNVKGMSVKHMKRLGKLLDEFDNEFDPVLEDEQREALTIIMELVGEILTSDREDEDGTM